MSFNQKNILTIKSGFKYKCIIILIDGYRLMKAAKTYSLNWEEEQFTALLIEFIKQCPNRNKWKIHIDPENRLYDNKIISGEKLPKEAARIDMKMFSWQQTTEDTFYVEAKNLCEKDWIKPDDSKVSAPYLLNRYINTGISHFFSGYYPSNSCLCGYILSGENKRVIGKLNEILIKKFYNTLMIMDPVNNHDLVYKIFNNNLEIINIFFDFKFSKL